MFVSLLQLFGFPVAKAVHSRAEENSDSKPEKASQRGITGDTNGRAEIARNQPVSEVHAQASSVRRQELKAKPGKAKVPSKVPAKASKAVVSAKPLKKAVAKPVAKPASKVPAKPISKLAPKPAAKSVAKPVAAKSSARAAVKVVAKVAAKVASKAVVKAKPQKVVTTPVIKIEPKGNVKESAVKVKPAAAAVVAPKPMPAPVASPVVPPKAGRPSSRLASLTVPSMAQSVASTAAKASYTQTQSSPLIVPPLPSAVKKDPKLANNWKTKPVDQLTDAELMAMPDSEYMNATQLAAFKLKLITLKLDILSNAGETTEHLREDTVVVPDPADRATIEEEHALELRTRDRERKLLKKIEQSITRIDAGDYGYCDETGESIGVGRLLARPTATLSLEAQQRRELKQKMFGD
jgi:DnaK suppressor protein